MPPQTASANRAPKSLHLCHGDRQGWGVSVAVEARGHRLCGVSRGGEATGDEGVRCGLQGEGGKGGQS